MDSKALPDALAQRMQALFDSGQGRRLTLPNPALLDFSGNDYLGIAEKMQQSQQLYPLSGSGGSRLLGGNYPEHEALEQFCAAWFQGDSALFFNSGYMANLGVLSVLAGRQDTYLYDERCHASLKDGIRLSLAESYSYRSLDDLRHKITKAKGAVYIVTEALFSMDGDVLPLGDIVSIARETGASIVLDESHSTGLFGIEGNGLACSLGMNTDILIRIHTFGKAVGMMGAVVIADARIRQYLISKSRAFIYTTSLPPALMKAILQACEYTRDAADARLRLFDHVQYWNQLSGGQYMSPIIPVHIPDTEACRMAADALQQQGFGVKAIVAPTVPGGRERLRIILHAQHNQDDIQNVYAAIQIVLQK
jgi:8-amino-7-oxononanoate synthase